MGIFKILKSDYNSPDQEALSAVLNALYDLRLPLLSV
jgi:hypothetical protein